LAGGGLHIALGGLLGYASATTSHEPLTSDRPDFTLSWRWRPMCVPVSG
jgi:hypothetical protein